MLLVCCPEGTEICFRIYCFASFETCRFNCHYRLPNIDVPTFSGCSAVDVNNK